MKKVLKISGIALAAVMLLLLVAPFMFKGRVETEIKKLANRSLKSKLDFSDVSLSFFRHFPKLTVSLTDFSLISSAPFTTDTLVSAREVALGIDLKSLFGKTVLIDRVYLDRARVNILYNEQGKANYDVYQSADSAAAPADTAAGAGLRIDRITFTDCRVIYADRSLGLTVRATGFDYSGKSQLEGTLFDLTSKIDIDSVDIEYGGTRYLDAKPVKAKLSTKVNTKDLTIIFEKNDLMIKDIPLEFHGKFNFEKDGYQVNLNFLSVLEKEFFSARFKIRQGKDLWLFARANASVDVGKWAKALDIRGLDVRGLYELNLEAEGPYFTGPVKHGMRNEVDTVILSIPKFSLMTRLTNGYLKYASLPQALEKVGFSLNAVCPDNDYRHTQVELKDLHASLLKNEIKGFFKLKGLDDLPVEANITAGCDLAQLKEAVPLDSIALAGKLALDVSVNGKYAPAKKLFPVTRALISLKEGSVLTKYYPHPIEKMNLDAVVTSVKGSMADLTVQLKPLTFEFEGKPFTVTADLQNFDDMRYDVRASGVIDLGKVYKVFSQQGMDLDGYLEADLALKGRQSDATAGRIGKLDNRGTLNIRDIRATTDLYPKPFLIKTGNFRFDQDKVRFEHFTVNYGASDFELKGYVLNFINYALSQGGTLKGDFDLTSRVVDVDEFLVFAPTEPAAKPAGSAGVVMLPRDLDVDFRAHIGAVRMQGLDIRDLNGEVDVKEGIMILKGTTFNLIGCKVGMEATYGDVNPQKAFFDFKIKAEDFDIRRAYTEVPMVREMMPSAGKAEGIVSLDYSLKGTLDESMAPVMKSLEGGGVLSVKKVRVYGLKLFNDISKGTEKEGIKNPDISKVDIASKIKNNTVTIDQFKFKVKGIRVRISGSTTFDQRMDLKIRLGLGPFGIIGIPMKVTGTFDDPKIKYGKGKDTDELKESDYSDQLPPEMLQRIRSAKEDADDAPDEPEPQK